MGTATAAPSRLVIVLIGAAIVLNYVDRGAVSVAAPLIQQDFGLTATRYGVIVSAFFWTYVPAQVIAGWLADRVAIKGLLAAGVATWGVATLLMGQVEGIAALIALRLLMGVGEGVAFPGGSKVIAQLPDARRGLANVALSGGIALGPLVGTLAGGALIAGFGWRTMFLVFGAATLLWIVPWGLTRIPDVRGPVAAQPAWRRVAARRELWLAALLHFAGTYMIYFVIAWLPLWLVRTRGFTIGEMALLTGAFYAAQALGGLLGGLWCDRRIAAGADGSPVRRRLLFACMALSAAGTFAVSGAPPALLGAIVVATGFTYGPVPNLLFSIGQTLAGPAAAGRWVGIQSGVGNLSGVLSPLVTGLVVDAAGYGPAFAVTVAVGLAGTLVFGLGVRRIAPLAWQ